MLSELCEPLAYSGSNRHTSSPASPPDKKEDREKKSMKNEWNCRQRERCGALFFKPSNVLCLHALPIKPEAQRIWEMTQFNGIVAQ